MEVIRSVGADHVIDYTQEDFTREDPRYDMILDIQSHRSIFDYKRILSPNGIFILIGGSRKAIFQSLVLGPLISLFSSKKLGLNIWRANDKEDVALMIELIESGKVKPVIDRRYPLSEAIDALRYFEEGHHKGKVVITMEVAV